MKETGVRLLSSGEYLLDSSGLRLLPRVAEAHVRDAPTLLVSDELDSALMATNNRHALELVKDLVNARGRRADKLAREILAAYGELRDRGTIQPLGDSSSHESSAQTDRADSLPAISVGPDASAMERVSVANANAILSHSATIGTPILMKNRGLPNLLRRRVTVIEIADQVESLVEQKQELTARLFGTRHKKAVKYFVGAVIAVGGFWFPPLGFAGAAFALLDP